MPVPASERRRPSAIGLGRAGTDVVVNHVADRDAAEQVVEEISAFGVRAAAYEADVSQEDQVIGMVDRTVQEFGTIDILVSNAGLQRDDSSPDSPLAAVVPCRARARQAVSTRC